MRRADHSCRGMRWARTVCGRDVYSTDEHSVQRNYKYSLTGSEDGRIQMSRIKSCTFLTCNIV
jgi:hypothetical protein